MARINPVPRSTNRMRSMVAKELAKHEELKASAPVWIGGTYIPFLGCIVAGIAVAAGVASSAGAPNVVFAALGGAVGAVVGRWLGKKRSGSHPVRSRALQVFLGATNGRVLVYEPPSFGKPGRLLAAFGLEQVGSVKLDRGGILKPTQLSLGVAGVEQTYEFSGLWDISDLLSALGSSTEEATDDHKPS